MTYDEWSDEAREETWRLNEALYAERALRNFQRTIDEEGHDAASSKSALRTLIVCLEALDTEVNSLFYSAKELMDKLKAVKEAADAD